VTQGTWTMDEQTSQSMSLPKIIEEFNPAWFAAVMGTAVVPLAVSFLDPTISRPIAAIFIVMSVAMFVAALVPWTLRFFMYPDAIRRDLSHPIAGAFFPTMPIALIIIGLNLLKYPDLFASPATSHAIAWWLWIVGSVGIYVLGFNVLQRVYHSQAVDLTHAGFGWYIPPVSKLLIPVAGFELAVIYPDRFEFAFGLSMISFGVGFFLFMFVAALVYQRYMLESLPASRLAATSFISVAPTAIIAVALFKLMHLFEANPAFGIDPNAVAAFSKLGIIATWGFSLWAFAMALLIVTSHALRSELPYALSWWAFTFPSGALAVATGVTWKVTDFTSVHWFYWFTVVFLLVVGAVVAARTVRAMITRQVFIPAH